jgi:hypothetical protein
MATKIIKLDIDGNPIKPRPKCLHCGKTDQEHNAKTRGCPMGQKHRTIGHTNFGPGVFEPKPSKPSK